MNKYGRGPVLGEEKMSMSHLDWGEVIVTSLYCTCMTEVRLSLLYCTIPAWRRWGCRYFTVLYLHDGGEVVVTLLYYTCMTELRLSLLYCTIPAWRRWVVVTLLYYTCMTEVSLSLLYCTIPAWRWWGCRYFTVLNLHDGGEVVVTLL